jgi:tetratricopeptide (TPR) repeat protein
LLGALLAAPVQASASDDEALVRKAAQDLQQENYDEALAALTETWKKGPHTPEKASLLGQTYRRMLNYPKAREYLEEALRLKPNQPQTQFLLADTMLALDKPQEALSILQALETSGYEPGQTAYLRGMAEAKEGRYSQALDYFRKAQEDPKVAQEAKFQASLALAALNRVKEARKSMEEAIAINTRSQTAEFAQQYMGILERRLKETKPFRANVTAGFDFDSNVTLSPGGGGSPTQVSGQSDAVFTQTATFEYNFFSDKSFNVLTQYSYFQNFHPRVQGFDIMSHYAALVPTYNYKSGRVWLPFSYNYVDVASDKYFTGFLATPTWLHLFNENAGVEFGARYNRKYYWTPVFVPEDDRSAKNLGGSLGLYYFFKKQSGFVQARVSYEHDFATGSNWTSSYYRLLLAALYPVTDRLKINAFVDLLYQPYDNLFISGATVGNIAGNPLILGPRRLDKIIIPGLQITYELKKGFEFNLHYFFTRDKSNINIYNYSRHIVGCQLGYRY